MANVAMAILRHKYCTDMYNETLKKKTECRRQKHEKKLLSEEYCETWKLQKRGML
jgi:hypothetical protein